MWCGLRTLFLLSTVVLLLSPLSASSALPAVLGVARVVIAIAGAVWTGVNLAFVGARSAAFAQADDIWVSDPPGVTPAELRGGTFERNTAQWNIGRVSSVSTAPVVAPSGNAITIRAETNWEPLAFTFSPTINITNHKLADDAGLLWGQGFTVGSFRGVVTKEYGQWGNSEEVDLSFVEIPFKYVISDISFPYEDNVERASLDLNLHAWRMDNDSTEPMNSSWREKIVLASVSLDKQSFNEMEVHGEVSKDDFVDLTSGSQNFVHIQLKNPIEREIKFRVPLQEDEDSVVLSFRVEVKGEFQAGKP